MRLTYRNLFRDLLDTFLRICVVFDKVSDCVRCGGLRHPECYYLRMGYEVKYIASHDERLAGTGGQTPETKNSLLHG